MYFKVEGKGFLNRQYLVRNLVCAAVLITNVVSFERESDLFPSTFNTSGDTVENYVTWVQGKMRRLGQSLNEHDSKKNVKAHLEAIYNTAKVCFSGENCLNYYPDLEKLMATSRDSEKLLVAWKGWHDATGRKMKYLFPQLVQEVNTDSKVEELSDADEFWQYGFDSKTFEADIESLMAQLQPLYSQLHAFVRRQLVKQYSKDSFPASGHIPAHLLGTMWSEHWDRIGDMLLPFPNKTLPDITPQLIAMKYSINDLVKSAEVFFESLGFTPMTQYIWNKSKLVRSSTVHNNDCSIIDADIFYKNAFGFHICLEVNQENYFNLHKKMWVMEYIMQPDIFRENINSVLNKAVSEGIKLFIQTPDYLHENGLLTEWQDDNEMNIKLLMNTALQKVAFLPFGYVVDEWRFSVFGNVTSQKNYNKYWWELRCRHQGIAPPEPRLETDFDPGASFPVVSKDLNVRYFLGSIMQFQIYKAACEATGHRGPLHRCNIYGNKAAGDKLKRLLHIGSSHSWSVALEVMTGQRGIDPKPMLDYFEPLYQFLKKENNNDYGWNPHCPKFDDNEDFDAGKDFNQTEVEEALNFTQNYNSQILKIKNILSNAGFNFDTNITDYNQEVQVNLSLTLAKFNRESGLEGKKFNTSRLPYDIADQIEVISAPGISAQSNETKFARLTFVQTRMKEVYSTAKACFTDSVCLPLDPNITEIMATSSNYDELLAAWKLWRDASGAKIKDLFIEHVALHNEAIRLAGYNNSKESWLKGYGFNFEEVLANLFAEIRPLYEQLHAYVRRCLMTKYGKDKFPSTGQIPAHILGNMWAQKWENVFSAVMPFPNKTFPNIMEEIINKNFTVTDMVKFAESFFVSLGFKNMTKTFWAKSEFVKPKDGRGFTCHASAYNMFAPDDFRIKMCAELKQDSLITLHHEMGHIQYYMEYENQPYVYQSGANDGFHEAVGDLMALSVQSPEHMTKIKLWDKYSHDNESDINFLMSMALSKVAFLPFGYLIDNWRWSVFTGATTPENYNEHWWNLRCRYQGVSPPVKRSSSDFDPGAKFHVASNTPYIRYFISHIIQFQFHKAACDLSGHKGPLHKCDIFGSKAAGEKIRKMLRMGASKPWPLALKVLTGQHAMSAEPLLSYFKPLMEFLKKENGNEYGWAPQCPTYPDK